MNNRNWSCRFGSRRSFSLRLVKYGAKPFWCAIIAMLFLLVSGSPALAQTTLAPATLAFGNQALNETSASKTATFRNTQVVALTISSIAISGADPGDYAYGGNCPISPSTLGAGKSCSITVAFTPASLGSRTATLTVTHSATTSPQSVALTGTGVVPVTLLPASLAFGNEYEGATSATKTLTLKNMQTTVPLTINSITISGTDAADFAWVGGTCAISPNILGAGKSCTITITFTPSAQGSRTASLSVTDNASSNPPAIALTGTALAPATVAPTTLTFASLLVGTTSTAKNVTLTNHLSTALAISSVSASGDFAVSSNGCASGVSAGGKCTIGMTFAPTAIGARQGTLTINVGIGSPILIPLNGTGNDIGLTSIAVSPANPSVPAGNTLQLSAIGHYKNGTMEDLTPFVTWSSSAMNVATISAAGLASTVGPGQTTVQASFNGINGSTTLTVTANFVPTGSMNTARFYHTATQLNNGDVLVVGGFANSGFSGVGSGPLASAELYNPVTASFAPTASLNTARSEQTATLLSNGMVLIAGGYDSNGNPLASAELYNPSTATFIPTGSLNVARYNHTATLLANGTVLVAGGTIGNGNVVASAELYNPTTGTFTPTGSLNTARAYQSATLLNNGTVLIAGGINTGIFGLNSAEIYNPLTGIFIATGTMTSGHAFHSATLLNNGGVLVAGGVDSNATPSASAELYDPSTGTFNSTGRMSTPRLWHTATLVNNGTVLVAGGSQDNQCCILTSAEVFDPSLGTFSLTGVLTSGRVFQSAVLLTTGQVLVAGGLSGGNFGSGNPPFAVPLASAELYEAATLTPANLVSIAVSPANSTIPLDTSQQFVATGTFSNNSTEQLASVSWGSSNSAVATISNDSTNLGNAYGAAQGTANLSACAGAVCGSTTLTVGAPVLVSIAVSPSNGTVPAGLSVQFDAMGTYSDGSMQDVTSTVTWSSATNPVAIINSTGLATGVMTGGTTIIAALGAVQGTATLTVTSPVLASISVTPTNPSIAAGTTQQFTATGTYSDGSMQNLTSMVMWGSFPSSVATITGGGLATSVMAGSSTIGATMSNITGTATLTVTQPVLASIAVTPANPSISLGSTQQFTAIGTYSDGSTQNLTNTATWSSSAQGVAGVQTGVASAVGPGQTTIEAASGAINGSTTLTVTAGFVLTGSLNTARAFQTATLLNSGMVLITGGQGYNSSQLASAEQYDPATGSFTATGSLNTGRFVHTATLLSDGMVLIAGGFNSSGALASAELYNPATGSSTVTGSLNTARGYHTATLLSNGMVLIAGGFNSSGALTSAELYNPATGTFTSTGNLNTARYYHTGTLLNNGTVLITGGYGSSTYVTIAELYDPETGLFTQTGSLNTARYLDTATLLNNGMVLIAGGLGSSDYLASAELYSPTTGTFTITGSLNTARARHTATLLNNGMVLIAGGYYNFLASAELYDPTNGTFSFTGSLNTARGEDTATLLTNGKVLVAGGQANSGYLASAELYEPTSLISPNLMTIAVTPASPTLAPGETQNFVATGTFSDNSTEQLASVTWSSSDTTTATVSNDVTNPGTALIVGAPTVTTPVTITAAAGTISGSATITARPTGFVLTGSPNTARFEHTATLLNNGMVLIAGGENFGIGALADAELYNPATGTFTATGSLSTARDSHTATLLNNGMVLIAGGENFSGILANAELYNPATGTFTPTGSLNTARDGHTATLLNNGMVLVVGGQTPSSNSASAELYDPGTGTFTATGSLNVGRYLPTATLLNNGMVLIAGGAGSYGITLASAELYDPSAGTFTLTGNLNSARRFHTATLLNNGMVMVAGGCGSCGALASAELYNPASATFTITGSLNTARYYHTATLLNNGMVLVAGGYNTSSLASAELYDPTSGAFTPASSLNFARYFHTATLLNNDMVLIAGGEDGTGHAITNAELY